MYRFLAPHLREEVESVLMPGYVRTACTFFVGVAGESLLTQVTLLATRDMMLAITRIVLPTTRATVGRTSKRSGHSGRRYSSGRRVHLYTDSVCAANVRAVIPQQRASTVRPWRTDSVKFSLREKNRPARLAASDSNPQAEGSGLVLPFAMMMGAAVADGFDGYVASNTHVQDESLEHGSSKEIRNSKRTKMADITPSSGWVNQTRRAKEGKGGTGTQEQAEEKGKEKKRQACRPLHGYMIGNSRTCHLIYKSSYHQATPLETKLAAHLSCLHGQERNYPGILCG